MFVTSDHPLVLELRAAEGCWASIILHARRLRYPTLVFLHHLPDQVNLALLPSISKIPDLLPVD